MLAAAPAWFADNLGLIAGATLVVVTVLILRMVKKAAVRTTLIVIVAVIAVFVFANRTALERCARTCECRLAGRHVTVPTCDPALNL